MKAKFYYKDRNAPRPNNPNHIGISVLMRNKEHLLFERRSDCNRWSLIGGGLEINESIEECAIREVFEETGISIKESNLKLIKIYSDPSRIAEYPDGNIRRIVSVAYEVTLDKTCELKCSNESMELRWFKACELDDLDIVETHRHIVEEYVY